jgi:O-methyltransferase involved in polyketide biosynthesis
VLDQSATATAQKVFEDMLRSFVLLDNAEKVPSGPTLVAAVRAYMAHEKEPVVSEDEMAVYLKIAAAAAASPRKKKRAA